MRRNRRWWQVVGAAAVPVAAMLAVVPAGPAHGSTLPYGPDVSSWQHPSGAAISWSSVAAAGNSFAIIKTSEGSTYTNPYFAGDAAGAKAAHLVVGYYHYARPALPISTAATQASYFVSATAKAGGFSQAGVMPPILDLEENGGLSAGDLITWTQTWLETVRQLTGRTPVVYSYPNFWPDAMGNAPVLTRYPLWLASYTSTTPSPIGGWPAWTMWQYTSRATVSGIPGAGAVDMSKFNGSTSTLASFANGTASSTWTVSAPHTPYRVAASPGSSSVTVSWVPGDDGGQVPTSYTVTSSTGATMTVPGTSTRATFTGLSTSTSYSFTVRATNSAGTSPTSVATPPVRPGTPPTTPTNLTATPGNDKVTVSWSASTNGPTSYKLYRCSPAPCTPTQLYFTLTGTTFSNTIVTPGVGYSYAVAAANTFGSSSMSAPATATPYGPPSAPSSFKATADGADVDLTWAVPTNTGGASLTGYKLTVDTGTAISLPATSTSYTATSLVAGPHSFSLVATNAYGSSPAATSSVGSMPGLPSAPTSLTAQPTADGATLSWKAPSSPGDSPVTGYNVAVDGKLVSTLGDTATTYTATGLTGVAHKFSVAAVNDLGPGPSATVTVTPAVPVVRTAGVDRYATAAQLFAKSNTCASVAVLARGDAFPDALAASYLASVEGPGATQPNASGGTAVLLTPPNGLPTATLQLMQRMGVQKVFVVGGTGAVSSSVVSTIESTRSYECGTSTPTAFGPAMTVTRIGGADRYATASLVAQYAGSSVVGTADYGHGTERTAILATGQNFPDAVAAGPAAYWHQFPLVLTPGSALSSSAAQTLTRLGIKQVVIAGGTGAVSSGVEAAVQRLGITTLRAAGAERTATATAMAHLFFGNKAWTIARGDDFADALAAAAVVGKSDSALLLTANPTNLGAGTTYFLEHQAAPITELQVIGGVGAVTDSVVKAAQALIR